MCIPYSGKVWRDEFTLFKHMAENVLQMNRSAKGLLIVTTMYVFWMALVWKITDSSPNPSNFLPAKRSHHTVPM